MQSMPNFFLLNSFKDVKAFEQDHLFSQPELNLTMDDTDMSELPGNSTKLNSIKSFLYPSATVSSITRRSLSIIQKLFTFLVMTTLTALYVYMMKK